MGANRELRRSFGWRMFAAGAGMAATFALSVIIVRALDLREAAAFFAILAALAIGPIVGRLGLGQNLIRLMRAEGDAEVRRKIAGTHLHATVLLTCLSAPVIGLVACNALIGQANFVPAFVLTTLLIALESIRLIVSDIFAAAGRVRASVATMHYVRSILTLPTVAIVVFEIGHTTLVAVLSAYVAVAATQLVVAMVHARNDVAYFNFSGGISTVRTAVGQGTQIFTLDFTDFMLKQGTIWLATAAFQPLPATQYAAAMTLAMQVTVLDGLCSLAVAPPAARLWAAGKKDQVVRLLSNAATLSTFISVSVVIAIALFGPLILELAYGAPMRAASIILLILAASGAFETYFDGSITLLIVSGNIAAAARTAVIVLVVALPCAVAAAWFGGPTALAVVGFLSVIAKSVSLWFTARRTMGSAPRGHWAPVRAARELMNDAESDSVPA